MTSPFYYSYRSLLIDHDHKHPRFSRVLGAQFLPRAPGLSWGLNAVDSQRYTAWFEAFSKQWGKIVTEVEKRELAAKVPYWFHSYDFGDGVTVQGHKTLDVLRGEWDRLKLSDLAGKTVLDINTWDGWFALAGRAPRR